MALTATSSGFDGVLTESNFALISAEGGQPYGAPATSTDLQVTILSGSVLTVQIAAGSCTGYGVRATNSAASTLVVDSETGTNTRWDLIALRRDWTSNTVSLVVVKGTTAQAIPAGTNSSPGNVDDQPLALVQVTGGQTVPTALVDLRSWPSKEITAASLLAVKAAAPGVVVVVNGVRFKREVVSGSPAWVTLGPTRVARTTNLTGVTGSGVTYLAAPPVPAGHLVEVTVNTLIYGTAGQKADVTLQANGTSIQTCRVTVDPLGVSVCFSALHSPSAATNYTVLLSPVGGSGTVGVTANAAAPSTLVVEPK